MSQAMPARQSWCSLLSDVSDAWPSDRWRNVGVVIGCSGGADSMALVHALAKLREQSSGESVRESPQEPRGFLVVAHFNHRLRGVESDGDQELAERTSGELGLRWACGASDSTRRDEASLRELRMRFLVDTAHEAGARYVAVAHSADDNVETLLHHLFRGTGPSGLAGIGSPRSIAEDLVLVRPLLSTRRDLIRQALVEQGIRWREDQSNLDRSYRRNWVRHELIPKIESEYPHAVDAIGRAIEGQREWRTVIEDLAEQWLSRHQISESPLKLRRQRNADSAVVIAAIQRVWTRIGWPRQQMTREHWKRLADTVASDTSERYSLPAGIEVSTGEAQQEVVLRRCEGRTAGEPVAS